MGQAPLASWSAAAVGWLQPRPGQLAAVVFAGLRGVVPTLCSSAASRWQLESSRSCAVWDGCFPAPWVHRCRAAAAGLPQPGFEEKN